MLNYFVLLAIRFPLEFVCCSASIAKPNININGRNIDIELLTITRHNHCFACSNSGWNLLLKLMTSFAEDVFQRTIGPMTKQVARSILTVSTVRERLSPDAGFYPVL